IYFGMAFPPRSCCMLPWRRQGCANIEDQGRSVTQGFESIALPLGVPVSDPVPSQAGRPKRELLADQPSRTNRLLSATTEVASVIVPAEPSTLLRQACSKPPSQGM